MSLKRISPLPAFNGIPAAGVGGTATQDLPRGPRYKAITLAVKDSNNANLNAIIAAIRVLVNGKVQRDIRITSSVGAGGLTPIYNMLDEVNGLNSPSLGYDFSPTRYVAATSGGTVTTALTALANTPSVTQPAGLYRMFKDGSNVNYITIYFAEPWRPAGIGGALAWGTGNLGTFQLEVDVKTSAGTVTMTSFAEVDKFVQTVQGIEQAAPMGDIVKWIVTSLPVTGTTVNWTNFPRRKQILQGVHFFDTAISKVQLVADSYIWREVSAAENRYTLASNGQTSSANRFDLVLDYDDVPEGAGLTLDGIQDLQFNLSLSDGTARNIPVLIELLGAPD